MAVLAFPGTRSWPVAPPPPGEVGRARASVAVIELLDDLNVTGRTPTVDDLDVLARWSGWGPMWRALDPRITEAPWGEMGERIRHLLPPEHAEEAEAATPNSFYTPRFVTEAAWKVLTDLGFSGGAVLEPGCGHGCFLSAAPPHLDIRFTGVERDPTTARIAALLHPGARIVNRPLETIALLTASYDAVVGNVPFANVSPYDPSAPFKMRLHNYFIWRLLDALRPGGIAVVVTSRFTMDSRGGAESRRYFDDMAELLGAVRLPSGWEEPYGTKAVGDMLVFRKRMSKTEASRSRWFVSDLRRDEKGVALDIDEPSVNEYFREYPGRVIGEMRPISGHKQGQTLEVRFDGSREEMASALDAALGEIVAVAVDQRLQWVPPEAPSDPVPADLAAKGMAQGRFEVHEGGRLVKLDDGRWEPVVKDRGEIMQLIRVRNAAVALMEAEADLDAPDADALRRALNIAYDTYYERFGALNRAITYTGLDDPETGFPRVTRKRPSALSTFRCDPDFARVLALEEVDDEHETYAKAPIMHGRVSRRPERVTSTDNPAEAVALSFDECARLDPSIVARLMRIDESAVEAALGDLAYRDPAGALVSADEYLSGNVRVKLAVALAAVADDPQFQRNVEALRPVVPDDLGPDDIRVRLGAPWVPTDVVKAFVEETVKAAQVPREPIARVDHQPSMALWSVEASTRQRQSIAATVAWGTRRANAYMLIQWALNGAPPVIHDYIEGSDGKKKKVRNDEETALADQKTVELQTRFAEWVWEDPPRTARLLRIYNDTYNSSVLRPFDGSYLTFPGIAAGRTPRKSQLDMVMRALLTPAVLCGHVVGAGKTGIAVLLALKLRALGMAQKPVFAVPGHLLEQTAREALLWFPGARILVAGSEDLAGHRRRLFAARCATGDWDLVILTHEAFTSLRLDERVEQEYLKERIRKYRQALYDADADPQDRTVKQIARAVEVMDGKLKELQERPRDAGVRFDELGVDVTIYDEWHTAKNLAVPCRTPGISASKSSDRAVDLHMKLWWLARRRPDSPRAMLMTGTPVSNTLAELYVLQLSLQPETLAEMGVDEVNAWAALYVESETSVEVSPDGVTFRLSTRPATYLGLPELRRTLARVADIRTAEQLGIEMPDLVTENIVNEASAVQQRYIAEIVRRMDDIHDKSVYVDPKEDNMLKACMDGRLCALDPSLVGLADDELGKAALCAEKVLELWRSHSAPVESDPEPYPDVLTLGPDQLDIFAWAEREEARRMCAGESDPPLQVVFCDVGTPGAKGPQVYGKVRTALVAGGMDPRRIRFVQDAKSDRARAALFADCRAGRVDVLMGSTSGLGTGTNVQDRLLAIHHLDAPWRPSDVAQRVGRAQRPGNRYSTVYEFRYVTEGSFDAYMWQLLTRKLRFIAAILTGDLTAREVPDIGDIVLDYAQAKALATGNPYLVELADVDGRIAKYSRLHRAHKRDVRQLEWEAQRERDDAVYAQKRAKVLTDVAYWVGRAQPGLRVDGRWDWVTDRTEIGAALAEAFARAMVGKGCTVEVGTYRGLTIQAKADRLHKAWDLILLMDAPGGASWTQPVYETWLVKGQVWRLTDAVDKFADTAGEEARKATLRAEEHRATAARIDMEADRPFAYAAELAAAEARKQAIENEMRREAMERTEEAA